MKNLNTIVDKHIQNGLYPCAQWKIIHQNNVHEGKLGFLDIESRAPIVENTLYRIWSMTKPIV
jgi:CubicO group peptidase (beta-lactamase class C family)